MEKKSFLYTSISSRSFLSKLDGCDIVNHKDGNKLNNHKDNLEWVTASENAQHAVDTGLTKHNPPTRGVYWLDLTTGEIINTFSSVAAAEAVDLRDSSVCRGKKKSIKGYGWKYIDEPIDISNLSIWQPIKDFEAYFISVNGEIFSIKKGRLLKQHISHGGYSRVCISDRGCTKTFFVHRLVAQTFIPNPNNHNIVDHINEIKTDNKVENLRWCTNQDNSNYVYKWSRNK